jgi:type IV secretion system protein VirB1
MILPLAVFTQLAASCGPSVNLNTLAAIARTESAFETGAINDNTDRRRYQPRSREEAIALATDLITTKRHNVDLGVMQVNSANLPGLGMTVADAFDPCKNINGAARVLSAAYRAPAAGQDTQPALLQALSRYNSGSPVRGFSNGYVTKVQASAREIVPAIRVTGSAVSGQAGREAPGTPPLPPQPPSWDVFGQARYARQYGGMVFSGSRQPQASAPIAPANPTPVPLQPVQLEASAHAAASPQ